MAQVPEDLLLMGSINQIVFVSPNYKFLVSDLSFLKVSNHPVFPSSKASAHTSAQAEIDEIVKNKALQSKSSF